MWYWTLFTLRMMARAGLATAVVLWVVGQWVPNRTDVTCGAVRVHVATTESAIAVLWIPANFLWIPDKFPGFFHTQDSRHFDDVGIEPDVKIVGTRTWDVELRSGAVAVDHWLLCLAFLIATLVTSWRWKPKDVQTEEPDPEAVTEDE